MQDRPVLRRLLTCRVPAAAALALACTTGFLLLSLISSELRSLSAVDQARIGHLAVALASPGVPAAAMLVFAAAAACLRMSGVRREAAIWLLVCLALAWAALCSGIQILSVIRAFSLSF